MTCCWCWNSLTAQSNCPKSWFNCFTWIRLLLCFPHLCSCISHLFSRDKRERHGNTRQIHVSPHHWLFIHKHNHSWEENETRMQDTQEILQVNLIESLNLILFPSRDSVPRSMSVSSSLTKHRSIIWSVKESETLIVWEEKKERFSISIQCFCFLVTETVYWVEYLALSLIFPSQSCHLQVSLLFIDIIVYANKYPARLWSLYISK